jgi:ADP-heptose:LPS heptosyltransferase
MKSLKTQLIDEGQNLFKVFDYLLWLGLDPSKFTKIKKEEIKKIIIINRGSIGELLLCGPIFKALKKEFNAEISIMVRERFSSVLENNPFISEIIPYKESFKENVENIKNKNFDLAVVIFPGSTKMSYMCLKAGIKYRIGCYKGVRDGIALCYTRRIFPINPGINIMEYYFKIIQQIKADLPKEEIKNEIYLSKNEKDFVKNFQKKNKIKKYAIVHPGFSSATANQFPSRKWPADRYAKIIDHLIEKYNLAIVMDGSKNESKLSEEIKAIVKTKNQKKVFICPDFSIRENFAIIGGADVVIEASSGMGHCVATAFDVPVVSMVGKTEEYEWKPWGNEKKIRYIYHNEAPCTACNKEYCRRKDVICMSIITAEEIKKAIDELLVKPKKKKNNSK